MLRRLYLAPVFLAVALMSGCAARVSYRTYDPYYHDYHVWTDRRCLTTTLDCRNASAKRGVRRLRPRYRQEYWRWRHDHR